MFTDWPYPHQRGANPDIVHAVGQLVMNWNYAELGQKRLAGAIFNLESPDSWALLEHIGNRTLNDAVRSVLDHRCIAEGSKDHIRAGLDWFNCLSQARNSYAHSVYWPSANSHKVWQISTTARGKIKHRSEVIDVEEVRSIAEEIYDLGAYLLGCCQHLDRADPCDSVTRKYLPRSSLAQPQRLRN